MQKEHGLEATAPGRDKQWRTLVRTKVGLPSSQGETDA